MATEHRDPAGVAHFTVSFGVVHAFDAGVRLLTGFDGDEILGSNGATFIHPDDRAAYIAALQNAIESGSATTSSRVVDPAGRHIPTTIRLHRQDGDPAVDVQITWDRNGPAPIETVPRHHWAPMAAQEDQASERSDAVILLHLDAEWVVRQEEHFVDPPWPGEAVARTVWDLLPALPGTSRNALERAMRQRQATSTAYYVAASERAFTLHAVPTGEHDLALIVRDVSSNQAAREASVADTRYSVSLQKLIDAARDALVSMGLDGTITSWNASAERIFGYTRDEAIGTSLVQLLRPQAVTFPDLATLIEIEHWEGEIEMLTRDGRPVITAARAQLMTDEAGTPQQVAILYTDVTEQRRTAHHERVQDRLENLALLASGVTHDLNSVFTPILLSSQLLQERVTDEPTRALLAAVESSAERGVQMIARLLAIARGEQTDREVVVVADLLEQLQNYCKTRLPTRITLIIEPAPGDLLILAERAQLLQVLVNLVDNAHEAIDGAGIITVKARRIADIARIEVDDTAGGIDPDTLSHIFDPFFTTKAASWGTGIGLAASRSIAEMHDGRLTAVSDLGRGSTFTLDLPLVNITPAGRHSSTIPDKVPTDSTLGLALLIASPDHALNLTVRAVLERAGYRILTAADIATARAWLRDCTPIDIVIADVGFEPDLRGNIAAAANSPVVIITGPSPLRPSEGADGTLLPQPVTEDALLATVRALPPRQHHR